jgi:hypothetical protein
MRQIIDNAKQKALQNQIIWAYPIALKLKEYNYTLSIQWAMECIQIYSSNLKDGGIYDDSTELYCYFLIRIFYRVCPEQYRVTHRGIR